MSELSQTQQVALAAPVATPAVPAAAAGSHLGPTVLRVAWMSIALGMALELVLLMLVAFSGAEGDSPLPFVADLAQKVSWSFLVCVGLAFGTAAAKARPAAMGLLGLVSGPVALVVAKSVHKGMEKALGLAAAGLGAGFPFFAGGLKAVEYALLGAALGYLGRKAKGLGAHALLGIATGLVFGAVLVLASVFGEPTPPSRVELVARGLNELLFPLGCSLVIYAAEGLGKRLPA